MTSTSNRRSALLVLLLLVAVALSACGTGDGGATPGPDDTDEDAQTSSPTTEPAEDGDAAETPAETPAADLEPVTWTMYHGAQEGTPYDVAAQFLREKVLEDTDGNFEIEVICCASLGDEVTTMDLYASGDIDLGMHFSSSAGTVIEEYSYLGIPFLFEDDDHWWDVMANPEMLQYWQEITESYDPAFRVATYGTFGVRNVYTSGKVLETVDDFQGLKIRLPESPILSQVWGALGVDPVVLPFPDVYSGLQSGVVEAAENCPWCMIAVGHHEVAKEYHYTQHETGHTFVFVRSAAYDELDPAYREVIDAAFTEMQQLWFENQKEQNAEAVESFAELGVTTHEFSDEVRGEIRDLVTPHQQDFAAEFGLEDFLEQVDAAR